jgi:hypothetical protein
LSLRLSRAPKARRRPTSFSSRIPFVVRGGGALGIAPSPPTSGLSSNRLQCQAATHVSTGAALTYFRQKAGKKTTSAENISSLPTSMFQDRNHFPKLEIKA